MTGFAKRLKEVRLSLSLKQKDIAEITNLTVSNISDIENGRRAFPFDSLLLLCEYLKNKNVSFNYLFTGEEPQSQSMITDDENRVVDYYRRLNIENQDYIKGEMVRLIKEQDKGDREGYKKDVAT